MCEPLLSVAPAASESTVILGWRVPPALIVTTPSHQTCKEPPPVPVLKPTAVVKVGPNNCALDAQVFVAAGEPPAAMTPLYRPIAPHTRLPDIAVADPAPRSNETECPPPTPLT